jgi:uncharacterized protein YqeY
VSLQEKIELDLREALKKQDVLKRDLLRVLIGEITKKNKIASDEEVVKCVKKQIESAKLCHTEEEIPLLEVYLPKELSYPELVEKLLPILEGKTSPFNVGELMKEAKQVLGKDFDGKRVSEFLKKL